ncbi:YhcG family protein [Methylicorpusculum sp.]|uniref:PDDEXK nuclease domain-containing protein n=1 Tax=Methylicorpusculum sp. TaxID=2713644 RepID=UPI0027275450|nr:PDDEXK nuclease domain-containing protein [Methylicorpusculum sp.]MDO8845733.1 PDDEXK nuclease domain-containing protein [Methylicorpusculum sp.]
MNLPATPTEYFPPVLQLIQQAKSRALSTVNHQLLELYWQIGEYLSFKVAEQGWGQGTVKELAKWLTEREPNLRGFYLKLAVEQRWSTRELEQQINNVLFERTIASPLKVSAVLRELHPAADQVFKDSYLFDFLHLPEPHHERDLQQGLIKHLKQFLLELGRDFCFIGQEFSVQVGQKDFSIDLLFFHRELQALVAFELKIDDFKPAYLGQLEFYLEALDRDHRKAHEAASIGVLLCKNRDHDVVEYALSRSLSPTVVAQYQTRLPDKALLQAKLDEFYELAKQESEQ